MLKPIRIGLQLFRWMGNPDAVETQDAISPDLILGAMSLTLALAISLPIALRYRGAATKLEHERLASLTLMGQKHKMADRLQTRRRTLNRFRRTVTRYVADVESRPIVPWTTAVSEMSRARPGGVWTTLIAGDGPRFKAIIKTHRSDLMGEYVQRLAQSPYVEYVSAPVVGDVQAQSRIFGRFSGE